MLEPEDRNAAAFLLSELMAREADKTEQALERPSHQAWFVGRLCQDCHRNGIRIGRPEALELVLRAFKQVADASP